MRRFRTESRSVSARPRWFIAVVLATASLSVIGCGSNNKSDDGKEGTASKPQTVKIAMTPFLDYMPWAFAKEQGLDKELGVQLEFTWLAQVGPSVQALKRGSIDIVNTCSACNFPFYKSVPSLRDFLIANQFLGFNIVGRKGAPSYDALVKGGATPEDARKQVFDYIKGKTFVIHGPVYGKLVDGMLENAGLSAKDVKRLDFPDDIKGATAFLGGEGDFYMGGLPQNIRLLLDNPDKFVNVGGTSILGPGGLWYSTIASDEDWLKANHKTALKLMAIWYRVSRYLAEKPGDVIPLFAKNVNERGASAFTDEQANFIVKKFLRFPTVEQSKETVFNPDSELYWKNSLDHYEAQAKKSGDLPETTDAEQFDVLEEMFDELTNNKELMDWINKAL